MKIQFFFEGFDNIFLNEQRIKLLNVISIIILNVLNVCINAD